LASRDVELILDLVAAFEDSGHTVLRVDDVAEAIDDDSIIDALVVADEGEDTCADVRRWRRRCDAALVVLSGSLGDARLAREMGGAYFQRPASVQRRVRRSAVGGDTVPDALWAPALVTVTESEIARRQRTSISRLDSDLPPSEPLARHVGAASRVERDILLVDDDQHIRDALSELLEAEGYSIAHAENGLEALALLRGRLVPRMILLDLMMPAMDGWELRAELDRDPSLSHIPVAVVSAFVPFDRSTAMQVEAVFKKPVDVPHLLGTIERIIG
jgi:CheY-like chemotaxis protein